MLPKTFIGMSCNVINIYLGIDEYIHLILPNSLACPKF